MFVNKYPYTDMHELNLDWLLGQMLQLRTDMKDFINQNVIKYADPIQWNITTQYEANTVVIEPNSGNAYISSQPVPAGVNITNTDYWSVIGNFDVMYDSIKNAITSADEGSGTTATAARDLGDLVWLNNVLYIITGVMSPGDAYVEGINCKQITIAEITKNVMYEDDELLEIHGVVKSSTIITTGDYHEYNVGREAIDIRKV